MNRFGAITIWLVPEQEESLSCAQLAVRLGVSQPALYRRIRAYGVDGILTYWPGKLPARLVKETKQRKRKEGSKPKPRRERREVSSAEARKFVLKLLEVSKDALRKRRCQSSFNFLTNKDGMLEWYLELMFDDTMCQFVMERLARMCCRYTTPKATKKGRRSKRPLSQSE